MRILIFLIGLVCFTNPKHSTDRILYEVTYTELYLPPASPDFSYEGMNVPLAIKEKLKSGSLEKQFVSHNDFILKQVQNHSTYTHVNFYMANIYGEKTDDYSSETMNTYRPTHYKDFEKKFGYVETNDSSKAIKYDIPNTYEWEIDWNSTKDVLGYKTYKATSKTMNNKYNVVAWFTEDIPLLNGPDFYHGLPGLILELRKQNIIVKATDVQIRRVASETSIIDFPKEKPLVKDIREWQYLNK